MTTKHETTRSAFVSFFSLQTQEIQNKHERKEIEKENNIAVKNKEKKKCSTHTVCLDMVEDDEEEKERRGDMSFLCTACVAWRYELFTMQINAQQKKIKRERQTLSLFILYTDTSLCIHPSSPYQPHTLANL